jgi:hypothetical protein
MKMFEATSRRTVWAMGDIAAMLTQAEWAEWAE